MDCFFCGSQTFLVDSKVCCTSCGKVYEEKYIEIEEDNPNE